jgi:hypothetical protein
MPGDLLERSDSSLEIRSDMTFAAKGEEAIMGVRVEADGVAALENGADDLRVLFGLPSDEKERGLRLVLREYIEDAQGPPRMRTVVERERHSARAPWATHHGIDEDAPSEDEDAPEH